MLTLRPYQESAKRAVYQYLRTHDDNPCVVIPTAGGKTPVMASICHDAVSVWNGRVLILAHVKELLEQTSDKLHTVCPDVDFGIFSAGLKRRDTNHSVIVAGIQSVYKRACDLDAFDLVMVDEAHLIPIDGDGMYRQFLADAMIVNPALRVIGFTATPFRLKTGSICAQEGVLNHVCYEIGVRDLIRDGYLCPLITKSSQTKVDTTPVHVRGGEFVPGELEDLMDQAGTVRAACRELINMTIDRNNVLIFSSGIRHGLHIVDILQNEHDVECGFVCGSTPPDQRDRTLRRFKTGELKYLCNVNVLTTGFDVPRIDCVVMLRPTMSPGLFYQMVGRGFRLHPGKHDCLVLDFGGNVLRHGPIDMLKPSTKIKKSGDAPAKECPCCQALIATGFAICPQCGHEFPPPRREQHKATASFAGILSGQVTNARYEVNSVTYSVHTKRGADDDHPRSLRVDYEVGFNQYKSEWICVEHDGYARQKANHWWRAHCREPFPDSAEAAVDLAETDRLAPTKAIIVRNVAGDRYESIVEYELGDIPEPQTPSFTDQYALDEIPF